jgi:galactokinase
MRYYEVPGRVELVGKHVDYAGGRSLTCAVDLTITASVSPLADPIIRVSDSERRNTIDVPLSGSVERKRGTPLWSYYIVAVARRFARDFPDARTGIDVVLGSTLPASAGLSSSSALTVALGMALIDANHMDVDAHWRADVPDAIARAEYFAAMETGTPYRDLAGDYGVGVRGGAQDHVAIVCAEPESVGQFAYLPARLERRIPWPPEYALAIGVSGYKATKTGNARTRYNRASDATRALVTAWNAQTSRSDVTLADALASSVDAPTRIARLAAKGIGGFPSSYLVPRLMQFREEVEEIVPGVGDAMRDRDLARLGALVDRSMALAVSALKNQVAETVYLARAARERGAAAASAFGAGFGGAVWAMVPSANASAFLDEWRAGYVERFPARAAAAQWILTRPAGPARECASR